MTDAVERALSSAAMLDMAAAKTPAMKEPREPDRKLEQHETWEDVIGVPRGLAGDVFDHRERLTADRLDVGLPCHEHLHRNGRIVPGCVRDRLCRRLPKRERLGVIVL